MRIIIIQGAFLPVPPHRGGAVEKIWFRLAMEFTKCRHTVTHISRLCDGLPEVEMHESVSHLRVSGYNPPRSALHLKSLDLLYSLRVRRILQPADIVVSNTFWTPVLLRNQERWGSVIVDCQRMPKGQVRFYKHVACIRVNSQAVKDAVLRECPEVAPIVRLIPNPLPFSPPAELPLEQKKKVLFYAGRIHPEKGLHLLADAWRQLSETFPDWSVEIAGPHSTAHGGGGEDYLKTLKERFGEARVRWLGPLYEPGALEKLYARAAVFVYPSVAEKGETFGLAPLEAMAYGAVPVVSALECFREFLVPDENGLVFDHRSADPVTKLIDSLQMLMNSPAGRQGMARQAFKGAGNFAPEKIATQFLDLFEELKSK